MIHIVKLNRILIEIICASQDVNERRLRVHDVQNVYHSRIPLGNQWLTQNFSHSSINLHGNQ